MEIESRQKNVPSRPFLEIISLFILNETHLIKKRFILNQVQIKRYVRRLTLMIVRFFNFC